MAYLLFISGGSGSGKSAYAERCAVRLMQAARNREKDNNARIVYAATMRVYGEEGQAKVERHRKLREGKGFVTMEQPLHIGALDVVSGDTVLVECLSNLLANEMYDEEGAHGDCVGKITEGILTLQRRGCNVVCVSCEVFADGVVYDPSTEEYIDNLGKINQILAGRADFVAESVCGIPVVYKDLKEGMEFLWKEEK